MTLQIEPSIAHLLPPLNETERLGLETDILERGVLSPLIVWNNILVDGHHRYEICCKHSLPFSTRSLSFESLDDAKLWAWQHQENRRNLMPFQRIEIALQFKPIIAAKAERNRRNNGGDRKSKTAISPCPTLDNPIDTKKELAEIAQVSHGTLVKAEYIAEHADEETKVKLRSGDATINAEYKRLKKEIGQQEREQQRQADILIPADERIRLFTSTVAEATKQIEAESIDWIITDPPYPRDFLNVYNDLAKFAEHALKDGGSLLCMVGQSYLPEILERIQTSGEKLRYRWVLAYLTPGGQATQLWERKVNTFWKPVLWFTKGEYHSHWIGDVAGSKVNDNDKQHHYWGQSESGMLDLMDRFVLPNQTICDPFLGGGTTGIVALKLKCRFIGLDCDPECVTKSQSRLTSFLYENND